MSERENLELITSPDAYFHDWVTRALGARNVDLHPETEFYLVNLLNQFVTTENLYARDAQGNMRDEPLALRLKEAMEQDRKQEQALLFRQVGDVSLYVAGFFRESLKRKFVDLGYYIEMGVSAYQHVASREDTERREVYFELSDRFPTFVDVLSEIAEGTTMARSEKDLLRLYDLWIQTGSDRAAKALREAGINPTEVKKA